MQLTPEEQELILKTRREAAALRRASDFQPQVLYSVEEKCQLFDKLHKMALEHYYAVKGGNHDKDMKELFFEAMMDLLGKDVWGSYNLFCQRQGALSEYVEFARRMDWRLLRSESLLP